MPNGHWPEKPYWEPPEPPDVLPKPSFSDERPPTYGESSLDKLAIAIYAYIQQKLEPVWEAINKLRKFIDDTVGKIQELIDKALECEHKFIETLVGKVYDYIGVREGLLRQWTEEWVSEKLSFFSDTLLDLRHKVTSDYINLQRYLEGKVAEVNDKLTLELEILGHTVRINGENYNRMLDALGLTKEEREKPTPSSLGSRVVALIDESQAYELSDEALAYLREQTPWKMIVSESEKIAKWSGVTVEYIDTEQERIEEVAFV